MRAILRLMLPLTVAAIGTASVAAVPQPTAREAQVIKLFDAALKSSEPLKALSQLPWNLETSFSGLKDLLNLRECQLYSIYKHRVFVAALWAESKAFPDCGKEFGGNVEGFRTYFRFKDDQVESVQVVRDVVIAASGTRQ